jgi:hypothetical protein
MLTSRFEVLLTQLQVESACPRFSRPARASSG